MSPFNGRSVGRSVLPAHWQLAARKDPQSEHDGVPAWAEAEPLLLVQTRMRREARDLYFTSVPISNKCDEALPEVSPSLCIVSFLYALAS